MNGLDSSPEPGSTRIAAIPARMIPLADEREWGLALPGPRYRPEVVAGVDPLGRPVATVRLVARIGYPPAIERLVADLRTACSDPASDVGRYDALMALVVALVRRAHDLTLAEAVGLLDLDEAGLALLVDAILATVAGDSSGPPSGAKSLPTGGGNA